MEQIEPLLCCQHPIGIPAALIPILLSAKMPGQAAEDGVSAWAPAIHTGESGGISGS